MALSLLFFNLIQRFDSVGGYKHLSKQHPSRFQSNIWYDKNILRDGGAMGWMDIEYILDELSKNGLSITKEKDGKTYWDEICVVGSMGGISEYECDWLEYDESTNSVRAENDDSIIHGPGHPELQSLEDKTIIKGHLKGLDNVYAGSVILDEYQQGFNCDCNGHFNICLPKKIVTKLNSENNQHIITLENYGTGNSTRMEFILEEESEIVINE